MAQKKTSIFSIGRRAFEVYVRAAIITMLVFFSSHAFSVEQKVCFTAPRYLALLAVDDVNGDGFDDLFDPPHYMNNYGANFYWGGTDIDTARVYIGWVKASSSWLHESAVVPKKDYNGDGIQDLIISGSVNAGTTCWATGVATNRYKLRLALLYGSKTNRLNSDWQINCSGCDGGNCTDGGHRLVSDDLCFSTPECNRGSAFF